MSLRNKPLVVFGASAILIGLGTFAFQLAGDHPERAWQAYLINFLLWSAVAQGGLLFSAVMHMTKARWSEPLAGLSECLSAFFPVSLALFVLLFLGKAHVFPWLHEELHGKEVWLNLPFLFTRDGIGLLILYGLGFAYLYYTLLFKRQSPSLERIQKKRTIFSGLYILAFALVLSLIGYDLVMAMEPHWYSTLFGGYTFVKAFYIGLGSLIILAAIRYMGMGEASGLTANHFHDIGKLFFAFCLLWADFFYVHLVVIWYGNISEETTYLIQRTVMMPWKPMAWAIFIVCFIFPFLILLNQKIKTKPRAMIIICTLVLIGLWFEHLLLLGPALSHHASTLPLGITDGLITLGFMGLMILAIAFAVDRLPELLAVKETSMHRGKG